MTKKKNVIIVQLSKTLILSIVLFFYSNILQSQIAQGYEVGLWKNFKTSALSYTFDDNTPNQLSVMVPMFDQYEYPTTLFTVVNWGPNWVSLEKAAQNGHEVASHTLSHPSLNTIDLTRQDTELADSQAKITQNVPSSKCQTIAYPNCNVGDINTIKKYYIAGRICSGQIISSSPNDFYRLSSIIAGSTGLNTANAYNGRANAAANSGGWAVFLFHAIDNESGYSPASSDEIKTHLDFVKTNEEKFWVGTFSEVVKYIKERNSVQIEETTVNSDKYEVLITDDLNDEVYDYPISIRRKLPESWSKATINQDDEIIASKIISVGGEDFIAFDIIPDHGVVTISNDLSSKITNIENLPIVTPNPFNNYFTIKHNSSFTYEVYSINGKMVENGVGTENKNIGYNLTAGSYILNVYANHNITSQKIIKN